MLVACTMIYTPQLLSQDKDCLKAPGKISGLYLNRSNSLDESGRQYKKKGSQVIIKAELLNLHPCNMFGGEARKSQQPN